MDGAVFTLLGLLLAFVFSGAAGRLETRRDLLVQEVNAISTARLRIDLLPATVQPRMRQSFDRYVAARRSLYENLGDSTAREKALGDVEAYQAEVWAIAVNNPSGQGEGSDSHRMLLPALNAMFDISTTRLVAMGAHLPAPVLLTLWMVTLASAWLAGRASRGSKAFPWSSTILFSALMAGVLYLIVDLDYPREGFIRIDQFDALLK